jgi:23S rRNA maturation-related 3'-5' exoribonuclease YhaM
MNRDVFKVELNRFKNANVRESTEAVLDMIPDYFYEIPASSSGKYHPAFSLGEGGLVRHVKVAMRVLEELFRDTAFGEYDDYTKDLIRMALLLHDGLKSGLTNTGHTCREHPVLMSNFILENKDKLSISNEDSIIVVIYI